MKIDPLAEGLDDYALERDEADTREQMLYWATAVASPCCRDCGYLAYAKHELLAATRRARARALGVFDEQPGEAVWFAGHRAERPIELDEMFLSVAIGTI